ncbi:MAG: hypothetical protein LUQ40_06705 [Methanomicrobiales archaeon]|nr:hypothetical protein [Methanomicrobiales archaeon]
MKMMQLDLTNDEISVLRKMIEIYLSDLRMEVADTEDQKFREGLKQEEITLKKILQMLT